MSTIGKRTLAEIAAEMRGTAATLGNAWARLGGGLEVALVRSGDGEHWFLSVKRMDVAPSETELRTLRKAFEVPEETAMQVFARRMLTPKTRENALYRGVMWSWIEAAARSESGQG